MKKWKIIIFVLILLFSIYKVIDSKNLDIKDNVYIVSQSDVHEKESISIIYLMKMITKRKKR